MPVSTASATTTPPKELSLPPILVKWLEGGKKKLNFFERIVFKIVAKKVKKAMAKADGKPIDADKKARQAHTFGWLSLLTFFIFPLASIPLAILAIVNGSTALEHGTTLSNKARTGRTVGIITLGLIVALIFLIIFIIANFTLA